jgi:hypothetical protein
VQTYEPDDVSPTEVELGGLGCLQWCEIWPTSCAYMTCDSSKDKKVGLQLKREGTKAAFGAHLHMESAYDVEKYCRLVNVRKLEQTEECSRAVNCTIKIESPGSIF